MVDRAWIVVAGLLLGCGPSVPQPGDGQQTGGQEAGSSSDTGLDSQTGAVSTTRTASSGEATGTGSSAATNNDGGGEQKFDVMNEPPMPHACPVEENLPSDQCFELGLAYPALDDEWALVDDAGASCTLMCLSTICPVESCHDYITVAVVHQGPRVVMETPSASLTEGLGPGGETVQTIEAFDGDVGYHVVRTVDTDTFSIWATDESTGEILWGPLAMHRYVR